MKVAFIVSDSFHRISIVNVEVKGISHKTFDEDAVWEAVVERKPRLQDYDKVGVIDHTPVVGYHWWTHPDELGRRIADGTIGGCVQIEFEEKPVKKVRI